MKKLFSVLLAICMVLAMSINVFADEMKEVYFESANRTPNDLGVGADVPWDGFGIGCIVNDHGLIENVTLADVIEQAKNGGILVMKFSSTGCWGTAPRPEIQFNCWENEETYQVLFDIIDNLDGTYTAYADLSEVLNNFIDAGNTVEDIANCGVQVWAENFGLLEMYVSDTAPVVEVAEDVDVTETDNEPADTGIGLSLIPLAVAASVVVSSKKR
ncbi:MAG: hypothetical protein IJX54_02600 [Oscillospiraceae bacterium]|nr:hypothetical protein [Oscillospiraceae bacterium]